MLRLRILTLNIWGLPIAADLDARLDAIGRRLAAYDADIVGLQEAWMDSGRQTLLDYVGHNALPHHVYFPSHGFGSGLMILSRHRILATDFHAFALNGVPEDTAHGDFYAGKGIGFARIETPEGVVDVYNTHPHAQYMLADDADVYRAHRITQHHAIVEFVERRSSNNPVILLGDFNMRPEQVNYRLVTTLLSVRDAFTSRYPDEPGITYAAANPYTSEHDQRLDYVFVRDGATQRLAVAEAGVVFMAKPDNGARAYSDHYGVLAELELHEGRPDVTPIAESQVAGVLAEAEAVLAHGITLAEMRKGRRLGRLSGGTAALAASLVVMRSARGWRRMSLLPVVLATGGYTAFQAWARLLLSPREIALLKETLSAIRQRIKGLAG